LIIKPSFRKLPEIRCHCKKSRLLPKKVGRPKLSFSNFVVRLLHPPAGRLAMTTCNTLHSILILHLRFLPLFLAGLFLTCSTAEPTRQEQKASTALKSLQNMKIDVPEPSGLVYNPRTKTLFTVADAPDGNIYELSLKGKLLRKIEVHADDPEGITTNEIGDTLYVAEEGKRTILKYTLNGQLVGKAIRVNVSGFANHGLEGITYVPPASGFWVTNEKDPRLLIRLQPNDTEAQRFPFEASGDLSGLCYDPEGPFLWLISDESQAIYKLNVQGNVLKFWNIPVVKGEGIALAPENKIFVVSDSESRLYVFEKPGN